MKLQISIFVLSLFLVSFISCGPSGDKAEVSEEGTVAEATQDATAYTINPATSSIAWEGFKPTESHTGEIQIKEGTVSVKDGVIQSGEVVIDMTSITNTDIEDDGAKAKLLAHLKGTNDESRNDFFDVRTYPTATFEVTKMTKLENDADGNNAMVYGNFTLKGQSKQVGFKATVKDDGNSFSAKSSKFTIDRTEWGVNFMSKSLGDKVKDNFIKDEIELQVTLNSK